jgi:DNA-binding CsgD family transcriptional regulator
MRNDLLNTLTSFGFKVDARTLKSKIDSFSLRGENCYFCFDLIGSKCSYFCPSIIGILGFDRRKYLNKGFLYFKSIIHPVDFLLFINEILTLVTSAEEGQHMIYSGNSRGITARIRHKNGGWIKSDIHLIYLKETDQGIKKLLLGFIQKETMCSEIQQNTPSGITSREKEVFRFLSVGNSAKMVADKLHISENTVVTHRKNLIQKLHVKNSAELITRGIEMNILNTLPVFG